MKNARLLLPLAVWTCLWLADAKHHHHKHSSTNDTAAANASYLEAKSLNELVQSANNSTDLVCYVEDNKCESWILFIPATNSWDRGLLTFLYFLTLIYLFLGIAIAADTFMSAIEVITAKERKVKRGGLEITVKTWNPTVANLTLMALGSSAPEILLSILETVFNLGSKPGELGPSTIVGSAAFNLLAISAVVVAAINAHQSKSVKEFGVFLITSSFSVWAYVWMYLVLEVSSPYVVEPWEAWITLLFFPVLVFLAWAQDNNWWKGNKSGSDDLDDVELRGLGGRGSIVGITIGGDGNVSAADAIAVSNAMKGVESKDVNNWLKDILPAKRGGHRYRINAIRGITGRKRNLPLKDQFGDLDLRLPGVVSLEKSTYITLEDAGDLEVNVVREKGSHGRVTVDYCTHDGTAHAGSDYDHTEGTLVFEEGETMKKIRIPIIADQEPEPDEAFTLSLTHLTGGAKMGQRDKAVITILDDDVPGLLNFNESTATVSEGDGHVKLKVIRMNGNAGDIAVHYETIDGTAKADEDFEYKKGKLKFKSGEMEKDIKINIFKDDIAEDPETFSVVLTNAHGAKGSPQPQIGRDRVCVVTIHDDPEVIEFSEKVSKVLHDRNEVFALSTSSWAEQFQNAVSISGEVDEAGRQMKPSNLDYTMHFFTIAWKVIFACIPPTTIAGGWATFTVGLIFIGILTAVVGEFASLFGCSLGLSDALTAISFVALGTSLPDTFASKQVFLGLGLPWVIASHYGTANGDTGFRTYDAAWGTEKPTLGFSVGVFLVCAVVCLTTFVVRRNVSFCGPDNLKGELGGSNIGKYTTATLFLSLWLVYITLSALKDGGAM